MTQETTGMLKECATETLASHLSALEEEAALIMTILAGGDAADAVEEEPAVVQQTGQAKANALAMPIRPVTHPSCPSRQQWEARQQRLTDIGNRLRDERLSIATPTDAQVLHCLGPVNGQGRIVNWIEGTDQELIATGDHSTLMERCNLFKVAAGRLQDCMGLIITLCLSDGHGIVRTMQVRSLTNTFTSAFFAAIREQVSTRYTTADHAAAMQSAYQVWSDCKHMFRACSVIDAGWND
jgi:hypothetical protein